MIRARQFVPFLFLVLGASFAGAQSVPSTTQSDFAHQSQLNEPDASQGGKTTDAASKQSKQDSADNDKPVRSDQVHRPVLWTDPGNITERDLFYGQGGKKHQPKPPFKFIREDMSGTNPKFDARDADGKKWRVKLGSEARPEVVASRLLWAVGYFANDDYLLPEATVLGLKMRRGSDSAKGDHVTYARFARKPGGQDKIGTWEWKNNPFTGTRELNGLRVMMAVMNNWDLKDVNNAVYQDDKGDRQIFLASDVGATFGTNGLSWTLARSRGNIDTFKGSKFIDRLTDTEVDFATPTAPRALVAETAGVGVVYYAQRTALDWIGDKIPRNDARWMGSLLAQLSHKQLVDAFRAGDFPPEVIDMYVELVEARIAELKAL